MSDMPLCADVGWKSILHEGEQLCGDHVEIVDRGHRDLVVVLADGLSSGVKASILSTLTSRIISTMLSEGMTLEECVFTIAATLPVDMEKGVAYSTFTILHIIENRTAEVIQYDNPGVILIRNNSHYEFPCQELEIGGKRILKSVIPLQEGDVFVAMSDGVTHASAALSYNYRWTRADVADYIKIFAPVGYTAKTLATMLVDECFRLYGEHPLDDATACVVRMRGRQHVSVMFGPPRDPENDARVVEALLAPGGKTIVCGGTTAKVCSKVLGRELVPLPGDAGSDIPPMSALEGIDLVTEGVVTLNRVNEYAGDVLGDNSRYGEWSGGRDGACLISRMLFEEGTDIHFHVGQAVNAAHANLTFSYEMKMKTLKELARRLDRMGKNVTVEYD